MFQVAKLRKKSFKIQQPSQKFAEIVKISSILQKLQAIA